MPNLAKGPGKLNVISDLMKTRDIDLKGYAFCMVCEMSLDTETLTWRK